MRFSADWLSSGNCASCGRSSVSDLNRPWPEKYQMAALSVDVPERASQLANAWRMLANVAASTGKDNGAAGSKPSFSAAAGDGVQSPWSFVAEHRSSTEPSGRSALE